MVQASVRGHDTVAMRGFFEHRLQMRNLQEHSDFICFCFVCAEPELRANNRVYWFFCSFLISRHDFAIYAKSILLRSLESTSMPVDLSALLTIIFCCFICSWGKLHRMVVDIWKLVHFLFSQFKLSVILLNSTKNVFHNYVNDDYRQYKNIKNQG